MDDDRGASVSAPDISKDMACSSARGGRRDTAPRADESSDKIASSCPPPLCDETRPPKAQTLSTNLYRQQRVKDYVNNATEDARRGRTKISTPVSAATAHQSRQCPSRRIEAP